MDRNSKKMSGYFQPYRSWSFVVDPNSSEVTHAPRSDPDWSLIETNIQHVSDKVRSNVALYYNGTLVASGSCFNHFVPARALAPAPVPRWANTPYSSPAPNAPGPHSDLPHSAYVHPSPGEPAAPAAPTDTSTQTLVDAVPIFLNDDGRSVWIDVQLGSLTQRMLVDTGATSIAVPKSLANDLLRRGEASLDDPSQVTIADGSTHAESLIRIETVRIGNRVMHDVIAGVTPERASPLLGFPVLNQVGRFTIDTKNHQLIFD
jgi:clan AA aspartic protease (TIGR02281 family)